jgi:hypothetical protein
MHGREPNQFILKKRIKLVHKVALGNSTYLLVGYFTFLKEKDSRDIPDAKLCCNLRRVIHIA